MPAWITIAVADIEAARHADLVEAVRRKALALGQTDPLPELIAATVMEIRGCIGFRSASTLDADTTTLAPNLVPLAVQKIARVMKGRIGKALDEGERDDERTYQKRLDQLKDGEWPVDAPANPVASNAQAPAGAAGAVVSTSCRQFTRNSMRGL